MLKVGILGASGYTGAELLRLLLPHGQVQIQWLTAERSAGKPMSAVFPQFTGCDLPTLIATGDARYDDVDLVFCALPHGTTQEVIAAMPRSLRVVDLSADFRLRDTATYAEWYGHEHRAPDLQTDAVYAITEFVRPQLKGARLVANPGCYPTGAQMPLVPLLAAGAIDPDDIAIDAKSGVSGAGRAAKEGSLFTEVAEGIHAYGVASHRHGPEIEQGLSEAAGRPVTVAFTPHLMPMSRGILSTIYVRMADGAEVGDLRRILDERFHDEPFVQLLGEGESPHTRHVRGTNRVNIGLFADRRKGRAIIISALDNLTKGASGQAVQNMNVMFGFPETQGLGGLALFP